jgi:hypothetical protein
MQCRDKVSANWGALMYTGQTCVDHQCIGQMALRQMFFDQGTWSHFGGQPLKIKLYNLIPQKLEMPG